MNEERKYHTLTIIRVYHGGYVVGDGPGEVGMFRGVVFACTSIDEVLAFIKEKIKHENKP